MRATIEPNPSEVPKVTFGGTLRCRGVINRCLLVGTDILEVTDLPAILHFVGHKYKIPSDSDSNDVKFVGFENNLNFYCEIVILKVFIESSSL